MRPTPVGDLTWVKATHNSPYGKISSEWRRDVSKFDWRVGIPANTTATLYVPLTGRETIKADGVKPVRFESGRAVFKLGSGKYHFVSK
jgi:alpha-L-rhamnosidase